MLDEFRSFFWLSDVVCEAVARIPIVPATQFATGGSPSDISVPGRAGTAEIYLV